ncbi:MAG: S41 family peptidase [Vallitaleaceae bacterium]|nr:S41 family peptidase [Vallitaleaceae bacterium]
MKKIAIWIGGILCGVLLTLVVQILVQKEVVPTGNTSALDVVANKDTASAVFENEYYESFDDKLNAVISTLEENYYEEIDKEALYEEAIRGLVAGVGDPYTSYFTQEEYNSFMEKMSGSYEGIGVVISYGESKEVVVVVAPFKNSPGEKAGIKPGDRILSVDGTDVIGMDIDKIVELIKGDKGTDVLVSVWREDKEIELTITRDVIEVPTIEYSLMDNQIGYIVMSGFDLITEEQFKSALADLEEQGAEGLILDLRNNPGGYLHIVYAIADELLDKGKMVVYTEDKNGNREELITQDEESFEKPIVVLINENSASASEILAGAIKDHELGTIVGKTSFGKGLVQGSIELEDGSSIKVTVSKYFTPDGNYINEVGIVPDVEVEADIETEQDEQLDKAIEVLTEMIER